MYKYCIKHLPAAFERMLNKNILHLSSQESQQTKSKSNLFVLFCKIDLNKQSLTIKRPIKLE